MSVQGIATEIGYSTVNESGAVPLQESGLPLGLPRQPDQMALYHSHAETARVAFTTLLEQEKLVGTYMITPNTPTNVPVWSFRHTASNVLNMHLRSMSKLFRLSSWTIHFKFEFRSNFQQVGQCLVVQHNMPLELLWYILGKDEEDVAADVIYDSYRYMTLLPHTKVAMGEDIDVTATLNWNIPLEGCYALEAGYVWPSQDTSKVVAEPIELGEIFVIAPIKMEIANGVTPNMSVRIWSRLSNLKLAAYDPTDQLL